MDLQTKDFTAASFYEFLAGQKLMGARCTHCGRVYLPPRAYCPACGHSSMEWHEFSGRARLLTFTVVYIGPAAMIAAGFDRKNPYAVGVVELVEGPRMSAMITGVDPLHPETIAIGAPLKIDFRLLGPEGAQKPVPAFEVEK